MTDITKAPAGDVIERVVIEGDLSRLTPAERIAYYRRVCETIGVNPFTKPFDYITLNGKLTLYAKRDCTDQLRKIHNLTVNIVSRERMDDLYVVTARGTLPNGRADESIGAVCLAGLRGDALANAIMKAETKAKRRVTLSIVGLGWLDETEVETIPNAQPAVVDPETGEIKSKSPQPQPTNGGNSAAKPQRPYDPETVKSKLISRCTGVAPVVAPANLRGATVGALELLFPNDNDEGKAAKRHMLTGFFFNKPKSEHWTEAECRALLAWATDRVNDEQYTTNAMAVQEAAKIIESLDTAQGQQPLM